MIKREEDFLQAYGNKSDAFSLPGKGISFFVYARHGRDLMG